MNYRQTPFIKICQRFLRGRTLVFCFSQIIKTLFCVITTTVLRHVFIILVLDRCGIQLQKQYNRCGNGQANKIIWKNTEHYI